MRSLRKVSSRLRFGDTRKADTKVEAAPGRVVPGGDRGADWDVFAHGFRGPAPDPPPVITPPAPGVRPARR